MYVCIYIYIYIYIERERERDLELNNDLVISVTLGGGVTFRFRNLKVLLKSSLKEN